MTTSGISPAARRAITVPHVEAVRRRRGRARVDLSRLGLLCADAEGLCARALRAEGVDPHYWSQKLRGHDIAGGHGDEASDEHVPFCPETRSALSLAGAERAKFRHDQVDTAHLFLALIAGA